MLEDLRFALEFHLLIGRIDLGGSITDDKQYNFEQQE